MSDRPTCPHPGMPDLATVPMAPEMPGFVELVRVKDRGMPYWWLWAGYCPVCGQDWLVAQEERMNDFVALRRLTPGDRVR